MALVVARHYLSEETYRAFQVSDVWLMELLEQRGLRGEISGGVKGGQDFGSSDSMNDSYLPPFRPKNPLPAYTMERFSHHDSRKRSLERESTFHSHKRYAAQSSIPTPIDRAASVLAQSLQQLFGPSLSAATTPPPLPGLAQPPVNSLNNSNQEEIVLLQFLAYVQNPWLLQIEQSQQVRHLLECCQRLQLILQLTDQLNTLTSKPMLSTHTAQSRDPLQLLQSLQSLSFNNTPLSTAQSSVVNHQIDQTNGSTASLSEEESPDDFESEEDEEADDTY